MLLPGDIVASPVIDSAGNILVKANVELTEFIIHSLMAKEYRGIYIFDELSDEITKDMDVSLDVQLAALSALAKTDIETCIYVANRIMEECAGMEFVTTDLSALASYDSSTYMHSVSVAKYCAVLGVRLGMKEERLKNLTAAALLHDIGKTLVPQQIVNKPGKLTESEWETMQMHTVFGYEILKQNTSVPSAVRMAVYEHHENQDGSGYPRGLLGDDIYLPAMVIHICDVYDAMISRRAYKEPVPAGEVVEYMLSGCSTLFKEEIVTEFLKSLVIFPKGTLVRLSDKGAAIVVENNSGYPLRPRIRRMTGEYVDLLKDNSLTIMDYIL